MMVNYQNIVVRNLNLTLMRTTNVHGMYTIEEKS